MTFNPLFIEIARYPILSASRGHTFNPLFIETCSSLLLCEIPISFQSSFHREISLDRLYLLDRLVFQSSFHRDTSPKNSSIENGTNLSILFSSSYHAVVINDDIHVTFQSSFHRGRSLSTLFTPRRDFQSSFHRVRDFSKRKEKELKELSILFSSSGGGSKADVRPIRYLSILFSSRLKDTQSGAILSNTFQSSFHRVANSSSSSIQSSMALSILFSSSSSREVPECPRTGCGLSILFSSSEQRR